MPKVCYLRTAPEGSGNRRRTASGTRPDRGTTIPKAMSFIVKGSEGTFTPAPAGTHSAVCVDVVDLGEVETQFGRKHRARFIWEIDEERPDYGDRFLAFATMNVSLHESSTMGALLRRWRGRDFTAEELAGFDVEAVVGAPCMLTIVHNEKGGTVYANVDAAVPLPKGMARLTPSGEYVRQKDRDEDSKDVRGRGYTAPDRAPAQHTQTAPGAPSGVQPDLSAEGALADATAAFHDDLPF